MARNLKALGLALAAVLALGAVTASGASAGTLTSTTSPVTLKATQTAGTVNALTLTKNKTVCPNATYTGHKITTTPHVAIPTPAPEMTITPHYGTCQTETEIGNFPTTVDMNGCDYTFKIGAATGGVAGTYGVTAGVVCPAGKNIVITIATGANDPEHKTVWCHVSIHYEPGVHYPGLHATNVAGGKITIHGTVTGFKSESVNTGNSLGTHFNFLPCSGTHSKANMNEPLLDIHVLAESSPAGNAISVSGL